MLTIKKVAGKGGEKYVPYDQRTGKESVVYFTRDLSDEGLKKAFDTVAPALKGKIAIKLHTGEPKGPNIIPRPWVKELIQDRLPDATIIETNTYYIGDRFTTEDHRKTLEINGWNFAPVDITDEHGTKMLPVEGGKWFTEMSVGKSMTDYDSMLTLTHFKGHTMGGFGGSNKNIGIGCADGTTGKKMIHTNTNKPNSWDVDQEELMEKISESTKATIDYFGDQVVYINVLRNMSVSCDCEGVSAQPVVTPDIGILASTDICAIDTASMDLVYALPEESNKDFKERVETRHGHRQLSYMKELGMGNNRYALIDLDNDNKKIDAATAVEGIKGGWVPDKYNV
ncbi:MAG: DUF362 domain-containing protein [Faecalicoccus sp.]|nr:DUF362 domain-containing protein [Faecalicoccus sp.]